MFPGKAVRTVEAASGARTTIEAEIVRYASGEPGKPVSWTGAPSDLVALLAIGTASLTDHQDSSTSSVESGKNNAWDMVLRRAISAVRP